MGEERESAFESEFGREGEKVVGEKRGESLSETGSTGRDEEGERGETGREGEKVEGEKRGESLSETGSNGRGER